MRITRRHLDPSIAAESRNNPDRRVAPLLTVLLAGLALIVLLLVGRRLEGRAEFPAEPQPERESMRDVLQPILAQARAWTAPRRIPTLRADVAFQDYQRLVTAREQALARGVHVVSETAYVDARFILGDRTFDTEFSLAEGASEVFKGEDRWPFQGAIVDGETSLGGDAFRLAPADRDTPRAWGYLHTLGREGLSASRLTLVRLWVNGDNWGLYGFEVLPSMTTDEMLDPIVVSFDTHAYADAQSEQAAFGGGPGIRYARIETRRGWALNLDAQAERFEDDPAMASVHAVLVDQFDGMATGTVEPGDVFDVEAMGHYLALNTLWHGTPVLDWRDAWLLYSDENGRLTPVGSRSSAGRGTGDDPLGYLDDPQVQRAYLLTLQELLDPEYLTSLRAEIEPLWVGQGWADSGLEPLDAVWDALARNQAHIRRVLEPERTLYADAGEVGNVLILRLRNVQPFPVEVLGLELGGEAFLPLQQAWVRAEDRSWLVAPQEARVILSARWDRMAPIVEVRVPLSALPIVMEGREDEIRVITRLWGLDDSQLVMPVRESTFLSGGGLGP